MVKLKLYNCDDCEHDEVCCKDNSYEIMIKDNEGDYVLTTLTRKCCLYNVLKVKPKKVETIIDSSDHNRLDSILTHLGFKEIKCDIEINGEPLVEDYQSYGEAFNSEYIKMVKDFYSQMGGI